MGTCIQHLAVGKEASGVQKNTNITKVLSRTGIYTLILWANRYIFTILWKRTDTYLLHSGSEPIHLYYTLEANRGKVVDLHWVKTLVIFQHDGRHLSRNVTICCPTSITLLRGVMRLWPFPTDAFSPCGTPMVLFT